MSRCQELLELSLVNEKLRESVLRRFRKYVRSSLDANGCLLWDGATDSDGYGVLGLALDGNTASAVKAHRIAYTIANGEAPGEDQVVAHSCDVRRCQWPEHLFLTDAHGNAMDMVEKGRNPKGETHGNAQLTDRRFERFGEDMMLEVCFTGSWQMSFM